MEILWDERKRRANLKRHGLDFKDAATVLAGETMTLIDDRFDYGEIRFVTFGMLREVVVAVVYTETNDLMRIISLRKATRNEEKEYYEGIRD
jgi:uncharacterized protein